MLGAYRRGIVSRWFRESMADVLIGKWNCHYLLHIINTPMIKDKLEQLLTTENDQLKKLNSIVVNAIEEESLLSQKAVWNWMKKIHPLANKIADLVAAFGGSWKFILVLCTLPAGMDDHQCLPRLQKPFDPFPFILLNLFLSAIAAVQAPHHHDEPKPQRRKGPATCEE